MSGIVGLFHRKGVPMNHEDLKSMSEAIAHRGLDGHGDWFDGSVGLGHRMLVTTPESAREKLPFASMDGRYVITADARLDNRDELFASLKLRHDSTGVIPDSEIILAAYRKWGDRCPSYLIGDFAFAIWDSSKQALFCARDHFGVKPFYYHASENLFAFGTESKAILSLSEVPKRLNEVKIGDYLTSTFEDKTNTFYEGIFRLAPAHRMTITSGSLHIDSYWSPDPTTELRLGSDADYAERFRGLLIQAVNSRLRCDFPVGSLLSGGLDSSSITCVARNLLKQTGGASPLSTFSAVFDEVAECDEREYINHVLAQDNVNSVYVSGDKLGPLGGAELAVWHQDEPHSAFNLFLNSKLYSVANTNGIRVILDGFDGDSTVSHGEGYLLELASKGRLFTLAKELRGLSRHFDFSARKSFQEYAWHFAIKPRVSRLKVLAPFRRMYRQLAGVRPPSGAGSEWNTTVNPTFSQRIGLVERQRELRRGSVKTEREDHIRNITSGHAVYGLEVLDKAAGANSLEPRYPFWDKRLVEFCVSLPPEQKMRGGWTRFVLREGMAGILPSAIQWRSNKSNLGQNFNYTLGVFERERLETLIMKNSVGVEEYVDADALHDAYTRFTSRASTTTDAMFVWKAALLAIWLQQARIAA